MFNEQLVLNHLAGKGCAQCSGKLKHTNETFVAKAEKIHGRGKYDYSEVVYMTNRVPVWITCIACNTRWSIRPYNHMNGKGCPRCAFKKFVSKGETEWLDSLDIDPKHRNTWININGRKLNVDALVGNKIYEFDGDYYHGNPQKFDSERINHRCGVTMGELYHRTLERHLWMRNAGYELITIWESDWSRVKRNVNHVKMR